MTELLYQKDSYLREMDAHIIEVVEGGVVLDRTVFHPRSGGVAHDTGALNCCGRTYRVVKVGRDRETGEVVHYLDTTDGLEKGAEVHGVIDWDRRYRLMRLHTAAHIISAVMFRDYGALITGGDIQPEKAKDDFSIESMDKSIFEDAVRKANEVVEQGIELKIYWVSREEAFKIPGIVKLANRMPPDIKELRIVEIPGIDIQADGGPHVKNTKEIGRIVLLKVENKGRNRKRMYYTVKP